MSPQIKQAFLKPGCASAPSGKIGGLPRRERLRLSLIREGYQIIEQEEHADLKIPDCHVPIGTESLHLCEVGKEAVEDRLLKSLRKPVDGFIARFLNRPLSLALTRRLMNTRVKPNHFSLFTLFLGLGSGIAVSVGGYGAGLIGGGLLQLQSLFDGVDGELARLRFQESRLGQWLDTISDDVASLSFLIGLNLVIEHPLLLALGLVGIVSFLTTQAILYYALAKIYHSGDLFDFQWNKRNPKARNRGWSKLGLLFRHDFVCLASFLLALVGRLDLALILSSVAKIRRLVVLVQLLIVRGLKPLKGC